MKDALKILSTVMFVAFIAFAGAMSVIWLIMKWDYMWLPIVTGIIAIVALTLMIVDAYKEE